MQLPALVGFSEAADRGHLLGHIASMVGMDHTVEDLFFSTYGATRLEPEEAGCRMALPEIYVDGISHRRF